MVLVMAPEDLQVVEPAADLRPVPPSVLQADIEGLGVEAAADLADAAAGELLRLLGQREVWRQVYIFRVPGWGDDQLEVPRWPIEGHPAVALRGSAVERASYRVRDSCRQKLHRSDGWSSTERVGHSTARGWSTHLAGTERPDYEIGPVPAGYLLEGQVIQAWAQTTEYQPRWSRSYGAVVGSWLHPSSTSEVWFEVTTGGTSGASPPAWPTRLDDWLPARVHAAGEWVAPPESELAFEPTTPGQTGEERPAFAEVSAGAEIQDGTVTWTARASMEVSDGTVTWTGRLAHRLPRGYYTATLQLARMIHAVESGGECDREKTMKSVRRSLRGLC